MLVFHVTFKCRPGLREEFLERIMAEGIDAACRAEAGNLGYDYYRPAERDDDLLLIEKWADPAALAAHAKQAHMKRMDTLKDEYVLDMTLEMLQPLKGPGASA